MGQKRPVKYGAIYSPVLDYSLEPRRNDSFRKKVLNELVALVFLIPFLIFFIVFYVWPLIKGVYISFHSWGILGKDRFLGLANYLKVFSDKDFYTYLWHSLYYVLLSTPLLIIIGLALALIINEKIVFRTGIRAIFFLPYVLSVAVVSFIWLKMFDSGRGLVNAIITAMGLSNGVNWLTDPDTVWWSIVIASVWWGVGFVMVLFLAGLQEIPIELYEAGSIDGANSIQKFFYITLPCLSRVIRIQIFFQIIAGLKIFGQVHIMTGGGPGDATRTLVQHIYITGFRKDFFGLAAAQSVVFCLFMLIVSAVQYRFVNKKV